jgi:hypothetical protein
MVRLDTAAVNLFPAELGKADVPGRMVLVLMDNDA